MTALPVSISSGPLLPITIGTILGFSLLLSYPLESDFPVSHETPQYIIGSLQVEAAFNESIESGIRKLATNPWYPISIALLLVTDKITPFSWPDLIIWLSVFNHLAIGVVLGYLAFRVHGRTATLITIVVWSATFTAMRPILNGWMAQWWSLLPTVIVLERTITRKYVQAAIWFVLTGLTHPLSAFVLLFAGLLTVPTFLMKEANRRNRIITIILSALILAIGIFWLSEKAYIFRSIKDSRPVYTIFHLLSQPFAPAAILAPIGFLWFALHYAKRYQRYFLLLFMFVTFWLTFNHLWLGSNFIEWRFEPYFLLSVSLTGGIGIAQLADSITKREYLRHVLVFCLVIPIVISAWHANVRFFSRYDGNNLLIPRAGELEAISWLKTQPQDTHILSSRSDLNYKWIPILSEHKWTGIQENDLLHEQLINADASTQAAAVDAQGFTHLVIFHDRGHDASILLASFNDFLTVYQSETVLIKQINNQR